MRSKRLILAFTLALPAVGACGGAQAIDSGAAESLQQQVRELATLTQEGNFELALSQAEALKAEVQAAQDSGAVAPGRADRIQANIEAFVASIQPAEPTAPAVSPAEVPPATEPAPAPPTFTAPAKGVKEDSRDPGETQEDREREAAEEVAEEAQKQAEEAQKRAEKEAEERQKQEEDREDD